MTTYKLKTDLMTTQNQPIRLQSADVYRGFVMLLMMAEVLQFHKISEALPTNSFWQFMAFNQSHVESWFLNLFPRENPFVANDGGYVTLSFIPTLATMISGLFAGNILISEKADNQKLSVFLIYGIAGLLIGFLLNYFGICPNVKRIWTPTWVIFSGGWCFLLMAFFYYVIDIQQKQKWGYWLMIIGMNSIAAYIFAHTIDGYISKALHTHLGENYDTIFGIPYRTIIHGGLILLFEWLILNWMYKKKIFIRI